MTESHNKPTHDLRPYGFTRSPKVAHWAIKVVWKIGLWLQRANLWLCIAAWAGVMVGAALAVGCLELIYKRARWQGARLIAGKLLLKALNGLKSRLCKVHLRLHKFKLHIEILDFHRKTGLNICYRLGGEIIRFGDGGQVLSDGAQAHIVFPMSRAIFNASKISVKSIRQP